MALTDLTLRLPDLEAPSTTGASWENKYLYPSFELPSGTVTVRTNLYPRPFPADSGTAGFSSSHVGAVLANEAVEVDDRPRSVKVTTNGVAAAQGVLAQAGYRPTTGIAGAEVHAARVKAPAGAEMRLWLQEYTVSPVAWVANRGSVNFIGTGDWQTVSVGGTKATAGNAMVLVVETRTAQAITFYVTKFFAVVGSNLGDYFDWLTPDAGDFEYLATGVEGNSTSIMRAKGILGVSDPGVYQSQEWAAEGTHSAFVPSGKTLTVALAEPSTVKVIARSAGQAMVGSTGVEARRNLCRYPNAEDGTTTGWDAFNGTTRTTSTEQAHSGTRSYKVVTPGSSTGEGIIQSVSATVGPASSGSTATESNSLWVYAPLGALLVAVATEYVPGGSSVANRGSTNFTGTGAWQRVIVSGAKATAGNILVTRVSTRTSAQAITFYVDDALNGDSGDYFDGNTLPSASGFPVWAGTPNASETILYGVNTDTATGADETLEVQATGHVALLEGYWDVLTVAEGAVASQVEERRNLASDPAATSFGNSTGSPRFENDRWTGQGTYSLLTGISGPAGTGVTTAARYSVTTGGTGHGFHHAGNPEEGTPSQYSRYMPVTPGERIRFSVYYRSSRSGLSAQFSVRPSLSGGSDWAAIATASTSVTTVAGDWVRASLDYLVPAGSARLAVGTRLLGTDQAGDTHDATCLLVERTTALNDYFDGNTPLTLDGDEVIAYAWAGAANASESIQYRQTLDFYTGPVFTGSSDITGYETAWLGAINESASTLTELIPGSPPLQEVISWSITEPGTPHNIARSTGSTGVASITAKATADTFWTISEDATVTVDGLEGSFEGTIDSTRIQPFNEHGDPSGATTFSVASVLNLLNAERTLPPVIEEPLSDVIQGYVAAVTPNLNITWLAFDDPIRTYGAWSGNVWDILKTVCAANKLEMALSGSTVLVRDLGTQIIRFDDPAHPGFDIENVSLSVTPGSGQYVEITYRDSTAINNQVTYNYVGNPSVEVNATGYGVDIRGFGSVTGSRVSN